MCLCTCLLLRITIWRKKFREKTNKHDNEFHNKAQDSILNFETVKYFAAEQYEVDRYTTSVTKFQQFNAATLVSMQMLNFTQQVILCGCLLGCIILSAQAVIAGEMTIGGWVAVQAWVTTIYQPLNFLGSIYAAIVQALIDVKNLSELLSEDPDIVDEPGAIDIPYYSYQQQNFARIRSKSNVSVDIDTDGISMSERVSESKSSVKDGNGNGSVKVKEQGQGQLSVTNGIDDAACERALAEGVGIEFRNVTFNYPSQPKEKGLKGVSFTVAPGTTTALVGSTGAGKTTISRLLFRFYDPIEGSVQLGDYDIKHCTQKSVRSMVGIVPQDTVLFNDSIMYNIKYGRLDATDEEVWAAAEAAQIKDFIESLPEGWDSMVGERGLKLSGGEKQRVAIARCLLKNPPVVLLDEATSALDTVTENSVQMALDALGHNRTVVIIAHRLSTIRHADQILAMDNGVVVERGSHEELVQLEGGVYNRLWNMQLRQQPSVMPIEEVNNAELVTEVVTEVVRGTVV